MAELDGRSLVTVAVGGGAGTLARHLLVSAGGAHGAAVTLAVNAAGAFLLGMLLERLTRARLPHARRRRLMLLLGTGALGGFTTYSALAVEVLARAEAGAWAGAVGYGLATVLSGLAAAAAGVLVGARGHREVP